MDQKTPQQTGKTKGITLSEGQRLNWLRLYRSENVGPATFRDLINHFGTASAAIAALPELSRRGGASRRIKICPMETAMAEMEACNRAGAHFVGIGESAYSPLLRRYEQAPPLIAVKGNTEILSHNAMGIVGSRNASISGQKLAERFAGGLGKEGYAIVSGLARGIDSAAHRASLQSGTIAVFAGGVDVVYPEQNIPLANEIIDQGGAIVSEMPMGWSPVARDFPRRNRIITGLSLGILVVEAARRSGSLITARLCNEAGRLVFAVPGSPLDPRSEGANHLIKQGALLASEVEDITNSLVPLTRPQGELFDSADEDEAIEEKFTTPPIDASETVRQRVISALGPSPVEIDDIIRFSDARPGEIQLVLLELDLAGRIEHHGGNRVSLIDV